MVAGHSQVHLQRHLYNGNTEFMEMCQYIMLTSLKVSIKLNLDLNMV